MQQLTNEDVKRWSISQVFQGNIKALKLSLDYSQTGEWLVTSRMDNEISLINALTGTLKKSLYSKKYGVDKVRFTHSPDAVLCSSNIISNHDIRYHSFYDNKYLRYFHGHNSRVTSLEMNPVTDEFMSACKDTIRVWSLNAPDAVGVIRPNTGNDRAMYSKGGFCCVAYDPEGAVFAVYTNDTYIRMYDPRNYAAGPFMKFSIMDVKSQPILVSFGLRLEDLRVLKMTFSPDGKNLLVMTTIGLCLQYDSFEGDLLHVLSGYQHQHATAIGADYSADGALIATGSEDGRVFVYESATGKEVTILEGGHVGPVIDLRWNPGYHQLASTHCNTTLWGEVAQD